MSLKDSFRALRRSEPEPEEDAATSDVADPMAFSPRSDGLYDGGESPDEAGSGLYLKFVGRKVSEAVGPTSVGDAQAAFATADAVGDFTPAGRFTVQARFERPVIYTVLATSDRGFTARRTDTAVGSSHEIEYVFVPASAS